MDEEAADAEVARLNRDLGERNVQAGFYVAVESQPGVWDVELRRADTPPPGGKLGRLLDAIWNSPYTP